MTKTPHPYHFSTRPPPEVAGGWKSGGIAEDLDLYSKLVHRARQARWGLNVTVAETVEEFFYDDFS